MSDLMYLNVNLFLYLTIINDFILGVIFTRCNNVLYVRGVDEEEEDDTDGIGDGNTLSGSTRSTGGSTNKFEMGISK